MTFPADALAAASHPDPYPYYARLVSDSPLHFNETLGLWVAAGAHAVEDALASSLCRVRPPDEPVPSPLVGTSLGKVFGQFARTTDGAVHASHKAAIQTAMTSIDDATVERLAREEADWLVEKLDPREHPGLVNEFALSLPLHVVGRMLGVAPDALAGVAARVGEFVRALAPGSTPGDRQLGEDAADALIELFERLSTAQVGSRECTLLAMMSVEMAREYGQGRLPVIANAIGLLMQSYEATAGLIGNTLVALARHGARSELDQAFVQEVLRFDAPVQNTRRFVAEGGIVAGREMQAGDAILVVLAAANRDPSVNPDPDTFDPGRRDAKIYTFGAGRHRCPGAMLAVTIAVEGVKALVAAGCSPEALESRMSYVAAPNVRIPVFHA